jgi:hypothetical protein
MEVNMIGDKLLQEPDVMQDCWNIFEELGLVLPETPCDESVFLNAQRLVELNNEVYYKANHIEPEWVKVVETYYKEFDEEQK